VNLTKRFSVREVMEKEMREMEVGNGGDFE
jgi:hypothetical protein